MAQSDMILEYMQKNGSITQAEAINSFGCYRLGARIWDLKQRGVDIRRIMESGVNRFGDRTVFARYYVQKNPTDCTSRTDCSPVV